MTVVAALDAIALHCKSIEGLKEVYTPRADDLTLKPIPRRIDDTPVGSMTIGSSDLTAGNFESLLFYPELLIWVGAADPGFAYITLAPFADRVIARFRNFDGITLGGDVTRCLLRGWSDAEDVNANGIPYLVQRYRFECLLLYPSEEYSS